MTGEANNDMKIDITSAMTASAWSVTQQLLEFTAQEEGCSLTAYYDGGGQITIGYGHTDNVYEGETITQSMANSLLKADLTQALRAVNRLVTVPITAGMSAALCDFVFNVGVEAFAQSTLLARLNERDYSGAYHQFERWKYDNGKEFAGLILRRQHEQALFLS